MNIPTNVKELAEYIPTDADGIRRKAANMNGQLNFDRQSDTLSLEQLRVLLPTYLNGRGQMVGDKRIRIMKLLQQLDTNGTPTKNQWNATEHRNGTPTKPQTERQPKTNEIIRQLQTENERLLLLLKENTIKLTNENEWLRQQIKPAPSWQKALKDAVFLIVSINGVFWQSMHFASLEMPQSLESAFLKGISPFGIGIGFEAMALLLTIFSDKETRQTWGWLIGFGTIAFCMNLIYYNVEDANGTAERFKIFILSFALPFSIVAGAHLYISNKRK